MNAKRVIVTRELPPPAVEMLSAAGFEVDVVGGDESPSRATLLDRVRGSCGILATLSETICSVVVSCPGITTTGPTSVRSSGSNSNRERDR